MHFTAVVLDTRDHAAVLLIIVTFCVAKRVDQTDTFAGSLGKSFLADQLDHAPKGFEPSSKTGLTQSMLI